MFKSTVDELPLRTLLPNTLGVVPQKTVSSLVQNAPPSYKMHPPPPCLGPYGTDSQLWGGFRRQRATFIFILDYSNITFTLRDDAESADKSNRQAARTPTYRVDSI